MSIEDVPNHWKLSEFVKKLVPAILGTVQTLLLTKCEDWRYWVLSILAATASAAGYDMHTFNQSLKKPEGE